MTLLPAVVVADLRSITESSMVDTCTVTRQSATTRIFDASTGDYTDPVPDTIYSGICRVRVLMVGRGTPEVAGESIVLRQYGATLPRSANDVAEGDILTVTGGDDAQLVGRPFYVLSVGWSTENLHRRLMLEDRQFPQQAGS